jgi:hypothetical protein
MSEIEYHGWIVLASSRRDRADDDFERGFAQVDEYIKAFGEEAGHAMSITEAGGFMHTLSLQGYTEDTPARLHQLMEFVGGVFDGAYGELLIQQGEGFDWREVRRYRLSEGRVVACDP